MKETFRFRNSILSIEWKREGRTGTFFRVTRQPMPDHPELPGLEYPQDVYVEVNNICQLTHGEGGVIYQHIISLTEGTTQKYPRKTARVA